MVKLHCDRCKKEIKEKYYTINFWEYELYPKRDITYDYATAACSSSYSRESMFAQLNAQKMYCDKCKNEIEKFIGL